MIKEIETSEILRVIEKPLRRWPGVIVHHTAWPDTDKLDFQHLYGEEIDNYHREGRGWQGMGYPILINPGGEVEVGDRWVKQLDGAHTVGHNHYIGIALVGNFSRQNVLPSPVQLRKFREIMNQFRALRAYPHRLFADTECPGLNINLPLWFRMFEKIVL